MSPQTSPKPLRPVLCRVGSKAKFAKMLNNILPSHSIYVEPFVGSGAVFFYKEPAEKEVINDVNKVLMESYKLIQKIPKGVEFPELDTFQKMRTFFNKDPKTDVEKLSWKVIEACGGWMSLPMTREWLDAAAKRVEKQGEGITHIVNPSSKLKHFDLYKDRLEGVLLRNEDYEKVMKDFDSKDTLFFCDPPYEGGTNELYKVDFDFDRFAKVCHAMKGKVVITLNDSPRIRELFKDWNIAGIQIGKATSDKHTDNQEQTIGIRTRKEVIITNFPLPKGWEKDKPSNVKVGKGIKRELFYKQYNVPEKSYSLEELSEISKVPISILQQVYDRGIGAYKTNPQSVRLQGSFVKNVDAQMSKKLSKEQWAMARVYSFLVGGEHDEDLRNNKEGSGFSDASKFSMTKEEYLREAKKRAKEAGYKEPLFIADDEDHKLMLKKPDGSFVYFGKLGYGDFLLWRHAESQGKVPKGTAEEKRKVFQKSHKAIKGDWKKDKYSPNMLALKINW